MDGPLVSVILPVCNGARFVGDALRSVGRQGYPNLEVIVVDDGSTDTTRAVVDATGIATLVLHQPNAGPAAARNRGLAVARGDLVAFLDADDLWPDGKLVLQLAHLARAPEVTVSLGRTRLVTQDGAVMPDVAFEDPDLHTVSDVYLGSGVFRRHVFETVGRFDRALRFGEDHDWFLRARELEIGVRVLRDVTLVRRLHRDNMTLARTPAEVALIRVLKQSLDRRRASGTGDLPRWSDLDADAPA